MDAGPSYVSCNNQMNKESRLTLDKMWKKLT